MRMTGRKKCTVMGLAFAIFIFIFANLAAGPGFSADKTKGHFPVSVWYAGGHARAPMLEAVTPQSPVVWRKDLEQIKSLGFNTVRPWIEWTACEKEEGKYDFSALRTVCDLANEIGLKVVLQVYIDSAPDWVGAEHPDSRKSVV